MVCHGCTFHRSLKCKTRVGTAHCLLRMNTTTSYSFLGTLLQKCPVPPNPRISNGSASGWHRRTISHKKDIFRAWNRELRHQHWCSCTEKHIGTAPNLPYTSMANMRNSLEAPRQIQCNCHGYSHHMVCWDALWWWASVAQRPRTQAQTAAQWQFWADFPWSGSLLRTLFRATENNVKSAWAAACKYSVLRTEQQINF